MTITKEHETNRSYVLRYTQYYANGTSDVYRNVVVKGITDSAEALRRKEQVAQANLARMAKGRKVVNG